MGMHIAILGASSQIASDLVLSHAAASDAQLFLYGRNPQRLAAWLAGHGLAGRYPCAGFDSFAAAAAPFDAVLNFVGVGDPARIAAMGAAIFDITAQYDQLALEHVRAHPQCRYIFLSSGAAYGGAFAQPAGAQTQAAVPLNNLRPQDWYAMAKLYTECRHRATPELPIVDLRVFNYFSRSQDPAARFLMGDIARAIRGGSVLQTSADYMVRDFLHPSDFYQLVRAVLAAPPANTALDCYSAATIDKPALLACMQAQFGLQYAVCAGAAGVNATGGKPHYYSLNRRAAEFGYAPALTSEQGVVMEMRALRAAAA